MKPRIVRHWVRAERRADETIACTGLDALLQKVPAGLIFMFEQRLDHAALLAALPSVLERYPLCAGRLRTTASGLRIVCNDAGIPVSVVELEQTCEAVLQGYAAPIGWDLVEPIRLLGAATGRAPLLTLRISHFSDRGSCLGIGWHHSLGDMQTFKGMMQALSAAVSGRAIEPPLMVQERGAYLARHVPDNRHVRSTLRCLSLRDLPGLARVLAVDNRRTQQKAFYFTSGEARAMRAALQEQAGRPLSVNDAVCAHMFELIANVDPRQRPRQLTVAVNWRQRLGLPLELLGNLVSGMSITCQPGRSAASIASEMRVRLERFVDDELDYSSNERFIRESGGAMGVHRMLPPGIDPAQGSMLVSSWKGFGLFDLDFGGARPLMFGMVGRAAVPWAGGVIEGFHNEGIIFGCYLPNEIVNRLCSEPMRSLIHRHQPKDERRPELIERLPWVA